LESLFELLAEPIEITDSKKARTLEITNGDVQFDDVSFSYGESNPLFQSLSFRVSASTMLAIVGPTGSGKSTIGRLLFRFYDVQSGKITIDGQDIKNVTQHSLRSVIGVVPQDTVLFNDTIRYNIAYGSQEVGVTFEEIIEAAKLARIHNFVMSLPDQYDTIVGERGLRLSGGEKQRVAIARAILKNPRIMLFDEATSALDSHTEKEIKTSIEAVSQGRTTIVIAHRLSTIMDAQQIIVLGPDSRIVESGTHQQLLSEPNGAYTRMWIAQQQEGMGSTEEKEKKSQVDEFIFG